MANLTLRQVKGSPLTIAEMDGNFEYFTGSYTNTGIITAVGFSGSFTGSITSASYATQALSSSYSLTATSSSYATSASYATNANNALTASYINPLEQDIQLTGSLTVDEGYIANFSTNSIALTIPTGYNALLVGPIYNSSSIIVQPGARLVII
jgi:hypothetical protein